MSATYNRTISGGADQVSALGTITAVTAGTGLTGGGSEDGVTLDIDVGTGANQIVQLDGTAKLPAVDGSQLTNISGGATTALDNLASVAMNADLVWGSNTRGQLQTLDEDATRSMVVKSGDAANGASGNISLLSGNSNSGDNSSGYANVSTGTAAGALPSGYIQMGTGDNTGTSDSGYVIFTTGAGGTGGLAGAIILRPGTGNVGAGAKGLIQFQNGTNSAGDVWTATDTSGSGHWAAASSGGATTALDNLADVAINRDLGWATNGDAHLLYTSTENVFGSDTMIITSGPSTGSNTGSINILSGDAGLSSGSIQIYSGIAGGVSGNVSISTGATTGTDNSGDVILHTGVPAGSGARGRVTILDGSEGTTGHVWTSTDTVGNGHWAAGGGGSLPSPLEATTSYSGFEAGSGSFMGAVSDDDQTTHNVVFGSTDTATASNRTSSVSLIAGDQRAASSTGIPGNMSITAGSVNTGSAAGGTTTIAAGSADSGAGGSVGILSGASNTGANGDINLIAAGGGAGAGGTITLTAGSGSPNGGIRLKNGSETSAAIGAPLRLLDSNGTATWGLPAADVDLGNLVAPTDINADLLSQSDGLIYESGTPTVASTQLNSTNTKVAQPFTPGVTTSVGTAVMNIQAIVTPPVGNLFADIYDDSSGSPGTLLGSSDALDATTILAGYTSASFVFSTAVPISGGGPYWIVFRGDGTYNAGTDFVTIERTATGANGKIYTGSWASASVPFSVRVGTGVPNNLGIVGQPWNELVVNSIRVAAQSDFVFSNSVGQSWGGAGPGLLADSTVATGAVAFGSSDIPLANTTNGSVYALLQSGAVLEPTSAHNTAEVDVISGDNYGTGTTGAVFLSSGNASGGGNTGEIQIATGSATGSGTPTSGNIRLFVGTASGTRGYILMEALYAVLPVGSSDPASAVDGAVYYKTGTGLRLRDGGTWKTVTAI